MAGSLKDNTVRQELRFNELFNDYKKVIEDYIATLSSEGPLQAIAISAMESGGKRIRPIMALLCCELVSGGYTKAIPIATCYELAHSASLIQDDIIDESEMRHNEATVHKKHGIVKAILASDLLLFNIFSELAKYRSINISKRMLTELILYIAKSAKYTAEGELMELELSSKDNITEEDYIKLASLKTASLFAAACASGAIAGGAKRSLTEMVYKYGFNLGIAFQINDDVTDIVGESNVIGKPVLKDIQNNATNIVIVNALRKADAYQRQIIQSMLWKRWFSSSEIERLRATLEELGSIQFAEQLAKRYANEAVSIINHFDESRARQKLIALAMLIGKREV